MVEFLQWICLFAYILAIGFTTLVLIPIFILIRYWPKNKNDRTDLL